MAIHYSDDLPHFAERDPPRRGEKVAERKLLQEQVEAFLAAGGLVDAVPSGIGKEYPLRRTKDAQINFVKRRGFLQQENKPK